MGHEVIDVAGTAASAFSWRQLFGMHQHVYGAWEPQSAAPQGADRMLLVMVRECAHCHRLELKREAVPLPPEGIPFHLTLPPLARRLRD